MLYGIVFGGLIYLTADELCLRLYRSMNAAGNMRAYGLLIPMLYCDAITDAMIKGLGQQKICVRYNILTSFLDVVFLYLLLPAYGMVGYFFSFLVTHLLNFVLSLRRLLKITGQRIALHVPVLAVIAAVFSVWAAGYVGNVIVRCICYILILGCSLFLLRVLNRENVKWIIGLIYK